ncbi:hypothetical protein [Nonomuraea sp. CA-141351]|uniref:hypothetical protein n=1 Tax=Nonomuraea sp. CA-141351 TaxID=3239996 RepID=UPI003D8FF326
MTGQAGARAGCVARSGPHEEECGGEVVVRLVAGCIHEHLLLAAACQYHVQELAERRMHCVLCFDVDGHQCVVAVLGELDGDGRLVVLRG